MTEKVIDISALQDQSALFGLLDENIRLLEREYGTTIVLRGGELKITGDADSVERCARTVDTLRRLLLGGEPVDDQRIRTVIDMVGSQSEGDILELAKDSLLITSRGRPLKPKTVGQKHYIEAMRGNSIVFGIGPAGTGKTYLAVAMAVRALKEQQVNRIILTRPAVEAGEKLGFLPGDLQSKVDPYVRPLYDALYDMMGADHFLKYVERGIIEVAPLAYMRGRTLDDSYVILDEAQNTTHEQMKMFLTRIGMNSKAIITGDITQIDLPDKGKSGLVEAVKILANIEDIAVVKLTEKDVVRHHLVQVIIKAYEKHENAQSRKRAAPVKPAAKPAAAARPKGAGRRT